jgi:tRNA (guanine37-N1)-methyltransferase
VRIDVVTIFPDYLAPLRLSLLGRAHDEGIVSIKVHDLRDWTHDRHRTVDDTPYGGGAGMVMRPEPWGEALDTLLDRDEPAPTIVFPSPAGAPFTQQVAERLAVAPWLVFAAGRYEGIDQRVVDHYAGRVAVEELSIGDYVLNGGEVAVMVMIEAIARLLPGFMGNPDSLLEESHGASPGGGLLEYPTYTKPPSWRGLDVPEVLLSGHHGQIARWRRDQSLRRTAERRADLLAAAELSPADREALE